MPLTFGSFHIGDGTLIGTLILVRNFRKTGAGKKGIFGFPSVKALGQWFTRSERLKIVRTHPHVKWVIAIYEPITVLHKSPRQCIFKPKRRLATLPMATGLHKITQAMRECHVRAA